MMEKKGYLPFQELLRLKYIVLIFLIAVLSYFFLDRPVAVFFSIYGKILAPFCQFVQVFFKGIYFIPMLGLLCIGSFYIDQLKKYNSLLCALIYFLLLGQICLSIFKVLAGRARPYLFLEQGIYGFFPIQVTNSYISFPSGHTINVMIATALMMLCSSKKQYWILAIGLCLSFTRVIYTQHYLSDWFVTAYLSFILIPFGIMFLERFKKYCVPSWLLDRIFPFTVIEK
jgi:hypothetical protein